MEGSASTLDENFLFSNFEEQPSKSKSKKTKKRKLADCLMTENGGYIPEELSSVLEQKEKYIQQLEEQNNKLKAVIKRVCGPQNCTENGDLWKRGATLTMPMAVVLYLNNEVSFACKKDVEESMIGRLANDLEMEKKAAMTQDLKIQPSAVPLRAFTVDTKGKRSHKAKSASTDSNEPHVFSAVHYYVEFCIDRTGLPLLEQNPGITEIWTIPIYEQIFLNALPIEDDDGKKVFIRQRKMKNCFNCLGDHNLNQCDQPRDNAKINANRQEFMSKFGGSPGGDSRYHQGDLERFKEFKAGKISDKLREALSLSESELPPYIYKMRSLGYPPGYLKSNDSNILMYGKEGEILDNYDDGEEGEIKPESRQDEIFYPGFNAPLEEGVTDRSIEYGMPQFDEWYSYEYNQAAPNASNRSLYSTPIRRPVDSPKDYDDDMDVEDLTANNRPQPQIEINLKSSSPLEESPSRLPAYRRPPPLPNYTPEKAPPPPNHSPSDSMTESPLTSIEIGEFLEKAEMRAKKTKIIDSYLAQGQATEQFSSHREWWRSEPMSTTAGILYFTYTPPPSLKTEIAIKDVMKYEAKDLDREPWKTDSTSWYDPLYGDLAAPTGIYDAIKEILKRRKRRALRKKF